MLQALLAVENSVLEQLARLHPRVCPRQILGVRIGQHAGELLDLALPRSDKLVLAIVEMDGCFADGVSVTTGCWFGRRTLRFVDYGKVAATFVDLRTGTAVRIWARTTARALAERYVPDAPDRWHAQLEAYRAMPAAELLQWCRVTLKVPSNVLFNAASERVMCSACGEEVLYDRQILREGSVLCRACAGQAYYMLEDCE
jgi:formylmethanofuran dehydrogenase subunit E